MSTVTDWLGRLTAYGYVDLGSDIFLLIMMVALLWDLERMVKLLRQIADALGITDDGDQVDDEPDVDAGDQQPPTVDGPPTLPAGAVIDEEHESLIERELGGRIFSFRPADQA